MNILEVLFVVLLAMIGCLGIGFVIFSNWYNIKQTLKKYCSKGKLGFPGAKKRRPEQAAIRAIEEDMRKNKPKKSGFRIPQLYMKNLLTTNIVAVNAERKSSQDDSDKNPPSSERLHLESSYDSKAENSKSEPKLPENLSIPEISISDTLDMKSQRNGKNPDQMITIGFKSLKNPELKPQEPTSPTQDS